MMDPRTKLRRQVKGLMRDLIRDALSQGLELEGFARTFGCTEDQLEREILRQINRLHQESF